MTETSGVIASFRDLRVWQEAMELAREVYALCRRLPKEEVYGLASQMKRAAMSVPSNIAEGHSRYHRAEYRQFVYVAIGSLAELETQVWLGVELGFFREDEPDVVAALGRMDRLRGMLVTLGSRLA